MATLKPTPPETKTTTTTATKQISISEVKTTAPFHKKLIKPLIFIAFFLAIFIFYSKRNSPTPLFPDIFDWYLLGWGESFHFAHQYVNEPLEEAIHRHEEYLFTQLELDLDPPPYVLDLGCGIGGPMMTILGAFEDVKIIGITNDLTQVEYGNKLLQSRNFTRGVLLLRDINNLSEFKDNSFDGIYAIETLFFIQDLESLWSELARILKPGGRIAIYDWLTTKGFDNTNPEHVEIMKNLEKAADIPPVKTAKEFISSAESFGFTLFKMRNLATQKNTIPWYNRLDFPSWFPSLLKFVHHLPFSPSNSNPVFLEHEDSLEIARHLVQAGKKGIFSPLWMMVFELE